MKPNIHPSYNQVLAKCVCGHEFHFYSSVDVKSMNIEVCNQCHPFYTGTQKTATVTGRVDSFNRKFQQRAAPQPKATATEVKPEIKKTKTIKPKSTKK
jgi:large subunit ribosomal protein L31